ncbi:Uncharacterized protein TOPH_06272, partial [Tolypocladium ophioglossoides CBS 100239]
MSSPSSRAAAAAGLTREQTRALFDILTHHETYAEIEAFKFPDTVTNYGFPFSRTTVAPAPQQQQAGRWWKSASATTTPMGTAPSTPRVRTPVPPANTTSEPSSEESDDGEDEKQQPSSSPLLQTLLTQFVLPLPGVRALPREFWSVRVQGLLARLGEAELSESYDKGALGTRKTLATGASAVVEMVARAALGGVERAHESADEEARGEYDCDRAEDLARAWEDVVQGLVYGDLVDGLFDHVARTEDLEGYSPAVKAAADYALVHLASLAHHIFIGSPEGQYLLKLLENVHSLVPYKLIKQTLRVGNAATMMSGMMRLLLAKLSVTSLTSWFGLTQSDDDGMNLLQRIVSLVLSWDAGEFRKGADRVDRNKDGDRPSEEALQAIRSHVVAEGSEHETVRAASLHNAQSVVVAILNAADPDLAAALTDEQHTQCLAYYSALLSVRDREGITAALCRTPPDLFTQMVRDVAAAYDPMIRSVHARVDLKEHLDALQGFVEEFIRASRPPTGDGDEEGERLAGVEEYVGLLRRNRGLLYRWVSVVAGGCPEVWEALRGWAREAMGKFRAEEDRGEEDKESRGMAGRLNELFASLEPATQAEVLEAIDAHAAYLATLNDLSVARLQYLITCTSAASDSSSSTAAGPGIYLARWQCLLDSTPITPATPHGALRHGRDVKHTTTMGKTGAGGRMRHADAGREYGPAAPDADVV